MDAHAFYGAPIRVSTAPGLTAHRGRLLSGGQEKGTPVHAASFIRNREIVLEQELISQPYLRLIFLHELFHFAWVRLSNAARHEYTVLLDGERKANARGEAGESSLVKKELLRVGSPERLVKEYVCESFCDTGAWLVSTGTESLLKKRTDSLFRGPAVKLFAGIEKDVSPLFQQAPPDSEMTLARRWLRRRRELWERRFSAGIRC